MSVDRNVKFEDFTKWLSDNGFFVKRMMSGYYQLCQEDGDGGYSIVEDDPTNEDYYDYESAIIIFYSHLSNSEVYESALNEDMYIVKHF